MSTIHVLAPTGEQAAYAEEEFRFFKERGLFQSNAQYWKEDMPEWRPVPEYIGREVSAPLAGTVPETEFTAIDSEPEWEQFYGGIGRLAYFGITLLIGFVLDAAGASDGFTLLMCLPAVYYRLKNIGMNPWLCALYLVPIANLFIAISCFAFPEAYQDTRKLDTAGWVVIALLFIAILTRCTLLIVHFS